MLNDQFLRGFVIEPNTKESFGALHFAHIHHHGKNAPFDWLILILGGP